MRPDLFNFRARLLSAAALVFSLVPLFAAAPVNDRCGGAIMIPLNATFPYLTAPVDITDATTNNDPVVVGQTVPSCQPDISRSVWYIFRPPATDVYRIATCGEAGAATTVRDTVLALYTNALPNTCGQPYFEVDGACSDDACNKNSDVTATLIGGVNYYILVWQYGTTAPAPGQGMVGLFIERARPPNDDCSNPQPVELNIPVFGSTLYARDDYDLGNSECFTGIGQTPVDTPGRDVVFSFVAPDADTYSFKVKNYNITAEADYDLVLFLSATCPVLGPGGTMNDCLAAANRNRSISEEVLCLPLASAQQVYIYVDDRSSLNRGSTFTLEVARCVSETETNSSIFDNQPYRFEITGGTTPVNDPDYYNLGRFSPGSRVFALVDAVSANIPDFDLRVVSSLDTLEYDTDNNDVPFGQGSGSVAGTPLVDDCAWLRVSHTPMISEPYKLYAVVQPPSSEAVPEAEPNGTIGEAQSSPSNYFSGSLPALDDEDIFAFDAVAGDVIFLGMDADPLRDRTPIDAQLELLNSAGAILLLVDDPNDTSSTNSGAGTLTGIRPYSPAESIVYRAPYTGRYYARVLISPFSISGAVGDYLLSITRNGFLGEGASNTPPSIVDISAPTVPKGSNAVVTLTVADPNPGPRFRAWINWGDNTPYTIITTEICQYVIQGSHEYSQGGTYTITVTVQDIHGASTATNTVIQITNPTADPANIKSIRYRLDGSIQIDSSGTPGATYQIQVSGDLQTWSPLTSRIADSAGNFQVIDNPPLPARRFYRAVWP